MRPPVDISSDSRGIIVGPSGQAGVQVLQPGTAHVCEQVLLCGSIEAATEPQPERACRVLGAIDKTECLSRLTLTGDQSLRRALADYTEHYHAERNHQDKGNVILFPNSDRGRCRGPAAPCLEQTLGKLASGTGAVFGSERRYRSARKHPERRHRNQCALPRRIERFSGDAVGVEGRRPGIADQRRRRPTRPSFFDSSEKIVGDRRLGQFGK